jgi:hypothetical protein
MIIDAQEVRAGRADDVELTVPKCTPGSDGNSPAKLTTRWHRINPKAANL